MHDFIIMKSKLILLFVLTLLANACENVESTELNIDTEILSISYGTYFGQCNGYCKQSITIENDSIRYQAQSWSENDNYPLIAFSTEFSEEDWKSIEEKIDFLIFRNIEEVIGCPDCADGGAEWIEIETEDVTHKIKFEYDNPPEEISNYIEDLSELLSEFQEDIF